MEEEKIVEIIEKYKDEGLIPLLQKLQEIFNYLPKEAIITVSKHMKIPLSKLYGVITFYSAFSLHPCGKYVIKVCMGTACHVKGQEKNLRGIERLIGIKEKETTPDLVFTLETVRCVGTCALAPVIVINDKYFGKMDPRKVENILNHYKDEKDKINRGIKGI